MGISYVHLVCRGLGKIHQTVEIGRQQNYSVTAYCVVRALFSSHNITLCRRLSITCKQSIVQVNGKTSAARLKV